MSTAQSAPISYLNKIIAHINAARYAGPVPDKAMDCLTGALFEVIVEMSNTPSIDHRDVHGKFDTMRTLYAEGAEIYADKLAKSIDRDLTRFSTVSDFIAIAA